MQRLVTTGSNRRGGAVCRGLQLLVVSKLNCAVELPLGIISSNVGRKNEVERFKGAVSKIFIDVLHQMTIKHLQEVVVAVDLAGAEVFWLDG